MTNNKIKELILYYDSKKDDYTSLVVIREGGTKQKITGNGNVFVTELENILEELKEDYGVTDLKDLQDRGIVKIKETNKNLFRFKNFVLNKKTLAFLTASFVLVTSSVYIRKSSNKSNDNTETGHTPISTSVPKVTKVPLPVPTIVPQPSNDVLYLSDNLQDYIDFEYFGVDRTNVMAIEVVPNDLNFIHTNDEPNFDSSIDGLITLGRNDSNQILTSLMNPENVNLTVGNLINYENLFKDNIIDFGYVQYFSTIRNKIIENAFYNQDIESVRRYVQFANKEVIRCIRDNQFISVTLSDGQIINARYSDLSNDAKFVIMNIAESFYALLNEDTFEYNGEVLSQISLENYIFTEERLNSFIR